MKTLKRISALAAALCMLLFLCCGAAAKEARTLYVTVSAQPATEDKVGQEWTVSADITCGDQHFTAEDSEPAVLEIDGDESITVLVTLAEADEFPDEGTTEFAYTIPTSGTIDYTASKTVTVEEKNGRYKGSTSDWTVTLTVEEVEDGAGRVSPAIPAVIAAAAFVLLILVSFLIRRIRRIILMNRYALSNLNRIAHECGMPEDTHIGEDYFPHSDIGQDKYTVYTTKGDRHYHRYSHGDVRHPVSVNLAELGSQYTPCPGCVHGEAPDLSWYPKFRRIHRQLEQAGIRLPLN